MKKITALLLAMTLAFSFCAFACADDSGKSGYMTISYTPAQVYELTIPADTSLDGASFSSTGEVKLSGVRLPKDKLLVVKMSSKNSFALQCGDESSIAYTVSINGNQVVNDCAVVLVNAGETNGSSTLSFATTEAAIAGATIAGEHKDTLTFEASVQDPNDGYQIGAAVPGPNS